MTDSISIKFGDVFFHEEKEYIFLAKTDELIYVAQILNKYETRAIEELFDKKYKGREEIAMQRPLFCYIVLQTEKFKDRLAHLAKPPKGDDEGEIIFDIMGITLDKKDLKAIKEEIINPKSPLDIGLKKLIKDIEIK